MKTAVMAVELTADHLHLGADAHRQYKDGYNPPDWVQDEATWEKAKGHILKSVDMSEDKFWPEVVSHYEDLGGGIKHTAKASAKNKALAEYVKAAHGETTGKPSFQTLLAKVNQAIQEDPRWDTDHHGQPEGSPGDMEPYAMDILVPDDDGQLCAVICCDDGTLVRHEFTWDGNNVTLADGDSDPTEVTQVYASEMKRHTKTVKAAGTSDGASNGHLTRKSNAANDLSKEAHQASAKAYETDQDEDHEAAFEAHKAAHDAHSIAYDAHAKAGTDEKDHHMSAMDIHKQMMEHHGSPEETEPEAEKSLSAVEKKRRANIVHCRHNGSVILAGGKQWAMGEPVEFMYMPAGVTTINAGFREGSVLLTVECTPETATTVQASFDEWVKTYPKQKPFGCVEHREQEASCHPISFAWRDGDDAGVFMASDPTQLGVTNVNGKVHRSWSPSFTTDAEYSRGEMKDGLLILPEGVRGSRTNPAQITGIDFCVGTLTNKPAFKNMSPVKAREAAVKAAGNSDRAKGIGLTSVAISKTVDADKSDEHQVAAESHRDAESHHAQFGKKDMADYHKAAANAHEQSVVAHSTDKEDDHQEAMRLHVTSANLAERLKSKHPDMESAKDAHMQHVADHGKAADIAVKENVSARRGKSGIDAIYARTHPAAAQMGTGKNAYLWNQRRMSVGARVDNVNGGRGTVKAHFADGEHMTVKWDDGTESHVHYRWATPVGATEKKPSLERVYNRFAEQRAKADEVLTEHLGEPKEPTALEKIYARFPSGNGQPAGRH